MTMQAGSISVRGPIRSSSGGALVPVGSEAGEVVASQVTATIVRY